MSVLKLSKRSANYTQGEVDCLLSNLESNPSLLEAKLGGEFKNLEQYRAAWEELADKISSVGNGGYFGIRRTAQDVKRKWSDMKSRVKAKATSLSMESQGGQKVKLSAVEERVLALISQSYENRSYESSKLGQEGRSSVKVFSFQNDSNSECRLVAMSEPEDEEEHNSESEIVEEIKSTSEDKKRRISEAFWAANADKNNALKRAKHLSEEEQLYDLVYSQREVKSELTAIREILKKCQLSVEKLAILKRAELKLKCAKYGVDFNDLFD